ncbi:hypothetical protein B0H12DRAFT_583948 [Mycena haematopus]|nr:hypothetical protein B0H12DRAFT_583948 [Mycena haematopus]
MANSRSHQAVPSSPETDLDDDLELAYPDDEPSEPAPPAPPPTEPSSSGPTSSLFHAFTSAPMPTPPPPQQPPPYTSAPLTRRPPSTGVSVPRVSKLPIPLPATAATPTPTQQPTTKPIVKSKSQYRHPRTEAQAQAEARISLPRLPAPSPAFMASAARAHPAGMMLPPPVPPHALPMPVPVPPPLMPPSPVQQGPQVACATAGCKSTVAVAGKRCLMCVKGSWLGRKDVWGMTQAQAEKERKRLMFKERERVRALDLQAWEQAQKKAGGTTPDSKTQRVTIKLKVTPKAKEAANEEKRKGKAAEKGSADGSSAASEEPEDKNELEEGLEEPKDDGNEAGNRAGWDSELSDLTSSDAETEVEETPRPSFKIRIPARTPTSSPTKPSASPASGSAAVAASTLPTPPASVNGTPEAPRLCTIARCRLPLPPISLYRWKCCSACRKQYREYQRARLGRLAQTNAAASAPPAAGPGPTGPPPTPPPPPLVLPGPGPAPRDQPDRTPAELRAQKEWEREENRRALEIAGVSVGPPRKLYREPHEKAKGGAVTWGGAQTAKSQRPMEGARVCTRRGCEHIIPSEFEYGWTMCGGCRGRERRMAERALVKEGKMPAPTPGAVQDGMDDFPVFEEAKPGRCMYADCGILMSSADADVHEAACVQCVRRKATVRRKLPGRPPGARNKPKPAGEKPLGARNSPTVSPEKPLEVSKKRKRNSPYPAYQCCEALLADFGTRFHGFIEAQSYYFLLRGGMGPQPPPEAMFDFSGEYSVVAADLDVVARKNELEYGVHGVKDAFARAGGLEFSPTSWVSILGKPGGVVTRFACVHLVDVILPIRMPPGHPQYPSRTKSMQGELEVAVLPDDSHKYFAGEKTIVRFRLVG